MDRSADLLVEEDRAGRARDAEVRADADLAQEARAVVDGQRALQVVVADLGAGRHHLAVAQLELHAVDVDARGRRAHGEAHAAVRAALVRAGEDLAAGHVALAVGVDPRAPRDAERQVGALGLQAQLARVAQAGDQAVLEGAQAAPRRDRVGLVEEQRAAHEGREVLQRHPRLRRRAPRSATASSTSASSSSPRGSGAARGRSARSGRGRRRPARGRRAGAWMPSSASTLLASVSARSG